MIRSAAIFPAMKIRKNFNKEMMKILNVLEEEKKKCFKIHPHIYLAVLGVSQNNQKRGFGAKMMRALLEEAEKKDYLYILRQEQKGMFVFTKNVDLK